MKSQELVLSVPNPKTAADDMIDRQRIIISREVSCCFWIVAAFAGCVFFSGWTAIGLTRQEILCPLDTINPNIAAKASLVRLPGVGPAAAQAIVDYRQACGQGVPAFRKPADMDAIKGFGPKTIEKMTPWLSFDSPEYLPLE